MMLNFEQKTEPESRVAEQDQLLLSYSIWHNEQCLESAGAAELLEYQMGQGQWPIQIELAMLGEEMGSKLTLNLAATENAFGFYEQEKLINMPAEDFKKPPEIGNLLCFDLPDGRQTEGQVIEVGAAYIKLDFNHPYSGRNLVFNINIVKII